MYVGRFYCRRAGRSVCNKTVYAPPTHILQHEPKREGASGKEGWRGRSRDMPALATSLIGDAVTARFRATKSKTCSTAARAQLPLFPKLNLQPSEKRNVHQKTGLQRFEGLRVVSKQNGAGLLWEYDFRRIGTRPWWEHNAYQVGQERVLHYNKCICCSRKFAERAAQPPSAQG